MSPFPPEPAVQGGSLVVSGRGGRAPTADFSSFGGAPAQLPTAHLASSTEQRSRWTRVPSTTSSRRWISPCTSSSGSTSVRWAHPLKPEGRRLSQGPGPSPAEPPGTSGPCAIALGSSQALRRLGLLPSVAGGDTEGQELNNGGVKVQVQDGAKLHLVALPLPHPGTGLSASVSPS